MNVKDEYHVYEEIGQNSKIMRGDPSQTKLNPETVDRNQTTMDPNLLELTHATIEPTLNSNIQKPTPMKRTILPYDRTTLPLEPIPSDFLSMTRNSEYQNLSSTSESSDQYIEMSDNTVGSLYMNVSNMSKPCSNYSRLNSFSSNQRGALAKQIHRRQALYSKEGSSYFRPISDHDSDPSLKISQNRNKLPDIHTLKRPSVCSDITDFLKDNRRNEAFSRSRSLAGGEGTSFISSNLGTTAVSVIISDEEVAPLSTAQPTSTPMPKNVPDLEIISPPKSSIAESTNLPNAPDRKQFPNYKRYDNLILFLSIAVLFCVILLIVFIVLRSKGVRFV